MTFSREINLLSSIVLLTVPTLVFGGLTLLGSCRLVCVVVATLLTGVALLHDLRPDETNWRTHP